MPRSPESFPSSEEEPTKEEEPAKDKKEVDIEEVRRKEAVKHGLSEKASFSEITAAIDKENREKAAAELGLPANANWIEIQAARYKVAGGKKYRKKEEKE